MSRALMGSIPMRWREYRKGAAWWMRGLSVMLEEIDI